MKVIKDTPIMYCGDIDVVKMLDDKTVDVKCMYCGNRMKIPETYISTRQEDEINYIIDMFNSFMEATNVAIREVYGDDPRRIYMATKLEKLKEQYTKPQLTLLK